jgi:ABC-type nitrate/sulfonate/bicarbonate transport system ATPase subunit
MLELKQVEKSFAGAKVLNDISFSVKEGEFVSIIGPSGSGKSTIFNILNGITKQSSGEVLFKGQALPEKHRPFAYMPQKDSLLPWRTIQENVILPELIQGNNKAKAREEASAHFPTFGLDGFENAYPHQLSGGMRQRANLLRTYMTNKDIFLLDEPFGSLDAMTRQALQDWLLEIWQTWGKTVLFITHDIDEALYLSDRVIVLSGRPGTVLRDMKVPLERPRKRELSVSEAYNKLKLDLFQLLGHLND